MGDKDKYLIDIAHEKTYQNQFDDYHKEFSKWRTDEKNPYGYNFVHDVREHTYVDGEGYFLKSAEAAERKALVKCISLLGVIMLMMTAIDGIASMMFYRLFQDPAAYSIYFSSIKSNSISISPSLTLIYGCMMLLKHLLGLWLFIHFTRIPSKVAVPLPKGAKLSKSGIFLMFVIMVFGRVSNYFLHIVFGWINIDGVYSLMIHNPDDLVSDIIYVVFNCILVSIVSEILFRGAIMQTFRQFGDTFAIMISSIAFSLTFYDLSSIFYAVLCSAALGLFTLRTGSLKSAIIMRVTSACAGFALSCLVLDNYSSGRIVEVFISAFIIGVAAFIFARLMCNGKWAFVIRDDPSEITNASKLRIFFTNIPTVIWLIGVLGMILLIMRFV